MTELAQTAEPGAPVQTIGLHIARVTIEAASPISLAAGAGDVLDVMLARDALGLPMSPGSSLQGVLKSLLGRGGDTERVTKLFGNMAVRSTTAGRLQFSNAAIHNSQNEAAKAGDDPKLDPLLRHLLADDPLLRDHVALDHRGTAADTAKFDRTAVPVGTRFSFELLMWGGDTESADFKAVLNLLNHPLFRLGGATRRGYGRVKVEQVSYRFFAQPTSNAADIAKLRGARLSCHGGLAPYDVPKWQDDPKDVEVKCYQLTPQGYWRAGGNSERTLTGETRQTGADEVKEVDDAFTREPSINWNGASGTWGEPGAASAEDYVLLGSSIRGALAHRALFHWNKANNRLIQEDTSTEDFTCWQKQSDELLTLFGQAANEKQGQRSALVVDDVRFLATKTMNLTHNSIDRFTGGVRNGALYSEEMVISEPFDVRILIDKKVQIDPTATAALDEAIKDLRTCRLSLGARSLGWFKDEAYCAQQESQP